MLSYLFREKYSQICCLNTKVFNKIHVRCMYKENSIILVSNHKNSSKCVVKSDKSQRRDGVIYSYIFLII